ncbi:RNA polymerase sigma factor [Candidatus Methylopumilus turicensis]|uniref:RNA polymerase, sigma-24 subunit, ECF subfamily n=1 Tax=Candidatus Methylopumilus turicensis TaxID=1581680 RepID=A0A0B7IXS6_9PROT|nr:RNA polymerase sigma factor [Candidatus Methylopumilus turicensis]CEN55221.1 RNA polymerase, sigma-24 subunit, ECF subfamily [Candidatus Methylopumilus turicensis]
MATRHELSDFLEQVERRAFKQTAYAVRDEHTALDIVQDAMMKLVEKYPDKPVSELPMLFQRILQNTMRDFWRRQKVRNIWTTLLSSFSVPGEDGEESDPLEMLTSSNRNVQDEPEAQLEQRQTMRLIEEALHQLPTRQREAFIMRYWEDMDVAETATAMGCSQGSVKTHCSRAVRAMASTLEKHGLVEKMLANHRLVKKEVNDEA